MEVKYSAGPWEEGMTMGKALLTGIGEGADGKAVVSINRDPSEVDDRQYDVTATTKEGKVLDWLGKETSDNGKVRVEQFQFDAPQADIAEFRVRMRPIRRVVFRNVSLEAADRAAGAEAETPAGGGSIKGTLTTDDPAITLDGMTVTAQAIGVKGKEVRKTAKASKDGSFSIDGLEPGAYQVDISPDNQSRLATKMFKEVNVGAGEAVNTSLSVVKGGRVRGRLVDKATRKPLTSGKGLFVAMNVMNNGMSLSRSGDIDKDGFYELVLAPGGWLFFGEYRDANGKLVTDWDSTRDFIVKLGQDMVVPDIEVNTSGKTPAAAGKIAGRVVSSDSTLDVSGLSVIAMPSTYRQADWRRAITAKDGGFTMDGVVPGEYQVDLMQDLERPPVEQDINHATVVADKTTELTISAVRSALVSGRAVDAVTRKPLEAGGAVSIVFVKNADGGGTTATGGNLREGGTYKYRLAPATYWVNACMQDATGKVISLETSKPTVTLKPGDEIAMPEVLVTMPAKK
jgi:hypothetical protein